MSFKDFIIYGAGISGFCMLVYGAGCTFNAWLKGRREDMRVGRAIRLGQMVHEPHDYTFVPDDSVPFDQEGYEDFFNMVDMSDDPGWIEDGIEWLSLHSTWAQKADVPSWDDGQAAA